MNCANHADISAVAYCRTCGKPLCANCTRAVRGVIYCENCLATRLEGVLPPAAPGPPLSGTPGPAPLPGSGPNPALAGILAGFFPVGVGAVYTGQYAKGDRKSTRLNSSHLVISYAVFCLKKKKHHLPCNMSQYYNALHHRLPIFIDRYHLASSSTGTARTHLLTRAYACSGIEDRRL